MVPTSRRDFLKFARDVFLYLNGGLAIGGLVHFLDFNPKPTTRMEFDLGQAANYPLDSRTLIYDPPAVLLHTGQGFSALSLECTHLGCTLEQDGQGYACPCHGSRFYEDGIVTHGPASKPLRNLRLEMDESGHLILFTN